MKRNVNTVLDKNKRLRVEVQKKESMVEEGIRSRAEELGGELYVLGSYPVVKGQHIEVFMGRKALGTRGPQSNMFVRLPTIRESNIDVRILQIVQSIQSIHNLEVNVLHAFFFS